MPLIKRLLSLNILKLSLHFNLLNVFVFASLFLTTTKLSANTCTTKAGSINDSLSANSTPNDYSQGLKELADVCNDYLDKAQRLSPQVESICQTIENKKTTLEQQQEGENSSQSFCTVDNVCTGDECTCRPRTQELERLDKITSLCSESSDYSTNEINDNCPDTALLSTSTFNSIAYNWGLNGTDPEKFDQALTKTTAVCTQFEKIQSMAVTTIAEYADACNEVASSTKTCCDSPVKCLFDDVPGVSMSGAAAAVAGGIGALASDGGISKVCNALAAATAAASASNLGFGAYCIVKTYSCSDLCNADDFPVEISDDSITTKEQYNESLGRLQADQAICDDAYNSGLMAIGAGAVLGATAGGIISYCSSITDDDDKKESTPRATLASWREFCEKSENSEHEMCTTCYPIDQDGAIPPMAEYENTLKDNQQCNDGPPQDSSLLQAEFTSEKQTRQQNRYSNTGSDPNQDFKGTNQSPSSYQQNSSRYGEGSSYAGSSQSSTPGGTGSNNRSLEKPDGSPSDEQRRGSYTSPSYRSSGGGGSSFSRNNRRNRRRFNLKDFLPGGKKDPKKNKLSRKSGRIQSVRHQRENLFDTHSERLNSLCSSRTLKACR